MKLVPLIVFAWAISIMIILVVMSYKLTQNKDDIDSLNNRINAIYSSQTECDINLNKTIDSLNEQINILKSQTDILILEQLSIKVKIKDLNNKVSHINDLFNHLLTNINDAVNKNEQDINKLYDKNIQQIQKFNKLEQSFNTFISQIIKDIKDVSERIKRCCQQSTWCQQRCQTREVYRVDTTRFIHRCPSR